MMRTGCLVPHDCSALGPSALLTVTIILHCSLREPSFYGERVTTADEMG